MSTKKARSVKIVDIWNRYYTICNKIQTQDTDMNKNRGEYYLGFDIGTDSVGWAVTDNNYNILKFNGKAMWGVRSFDEAQTAAERRTFRTARRRLQRRRQRIELLQEIFAEEISSSDPGFFQRLNDSKFYPEDKTDKTAAHVFFNDLGFKDKDYYKKYPTIYHLRRALITDDAKPDIRLLYLAIHHIIKYRGHFLICGDLENAVFKDMFESFKESVESSLDIDLSCGREELEALLKDKNITKTDKKARLKEILGDCKQYKTLSVIAELLAGSSTDIGKLTEEEIKISMSFSASDYEQKREEAAALGEDICGLIDWAKALYDWSLLAEILNGKKYISEAKIEVYEKHKKDLKLLKNTIRKYIPGEYKNIFASENSLYAAYAGHKNLKKRITKDGDKGFYKELGKILKDHSDKEPVAYILQEINEGSFLPLQTNRDNGVIPCQIHLAELKEILNNAEKHYPFLLSKDGDGFSARYKIEKILTFRIPYYVGPLNDSNKNNGNCWIVKKESGPVKPWNFENKVDEEASAEEFILRMTNKCTYLAGKDVLPKNSLLYSEFMVLNELNNLKIRGEKITAELKLKIFKELFHEKNKVTGKALHNYLKLTGMNADIDDITGFDKDFKSSLSSYLDFKKKVFKNEEHRLAEYETKCAVEEIIKWITIYGDDKGFLKKKIEKEYKGIFTPEQIKAICSLKYSGWGRLSKELLTGLEGTDNNTGETFSIIKALRETNDNFMQLLSSKYSFSENIEKFNKEVQGIPGEISYEALLKDAYISPSVKRAVWQTITLAEEIKNIRGQAPRKIFIEMARGDKDAKKGQAGRTKSRKTSLLDLYKNIKSEEYRELKNALEETADSSLQSKKLYLYYIQHGKCMYSGETIDIGSLADRYDIDHIYPRSKIKDDSLDNIVLVKKEENATKGDKIVSDAVRNKMRPFWNILKEHDFISKEKFSRLTRSSDFTDEELSGFINRQLVETRQSTKAAAEILQKIYGDSEIIYVKAQNVSDFRNKQRDKDEAPLPEFVKSRTVNDHHHAKDAYLNIVVGNVWNGKFTRDPARWLKQNPAASYHLDKIFEKDVGPNGSVWKAGVNGSIKTVKKFMGKNNILYTRYAYINKGAFFDQQLVNDNPTVPVKKGVDLKYGGYKGVVPAYFALIASKDKKGNEARSIEAVPIYLKDKFEKNLEEFLRYCEDVLNLKNPEIKIKCIKKNALLKIDGFPMHLKGVYDETRIFLQPALQFCLDKSRTEYIKKIEKFNERRKNNRNAKIDKKYDGISHDLNIKLYLELAEKSNYKIYQKHPANQVDKLIEGKDKFQSLSVEDQCYVLAEILKLFACKPLTADLTLIGGSKNAGRVKSGKKISSKESVFLINQSPTGLFETKVDLLKI